MRSRYVCCSAAVYAVSISVVAMQPSKADVTYADRAKYVQTEMRAYEIRPRPPTGAMREQNISDIEVREIQAAATNVLPKAIVSIGAVIVGCPCEDGGACTDQVWVVASRPTRMTGLLFSRIGGHWEVGPVQRWQLAYDDLWRHRREFSKQSDFLNAERTLLDHFPACVGAK